MSEFERITFNAGDGKELFFLRLKPPNPHRGPVMLVHGMSVRSNIFNPPVEQSLPYFLAEAGYDVWMLNWRASIDVEPSDFTLDDAAVHDYPAAVTRIREETHWDTLKAIVHCQGSTSFMMSICAGLLPELPEVTTVVSNAIALHADVRTLMDIKMPFAMGALRHRMDGMDAQWGYHAPGFWAKVTRSLMLLHQECDNPVCRMSSVVYGAGWPVLWRHENLDDATHEWLKGEVGWAPMAFFEQIRASLKAGELVSTGKYPLSKLPLRFASQMPITNARFVFMTGSMNGCFLPSGMARTFDFFEKAAPGKHTFQKMHGYGHLDVFLGKDAADDVFPFILDELNRE